MPFTIIRDDITRVKTDAIVNAANPYLQRGGGVCGAIFAAAGAEDLQKACDAIGFCPVGDAVITPGFRLAAKYIIHTPGPVYEGNSESENRKLYNCYARSLRLAWQNGCRSIAFPLISSGIYGYPKKLAFDIAVAAIQDYLSENDEMYVVLIVFDGAAFMLGRQRTVEVKAYIDNRYAQAHARHARQVCEDAMLLEAAQPFEGLASLLERPEETFSEMLFRLIDARRMTDPEVYRRANLDRRLFSKIRSDRDYQPSKNTVFALCVALRLNIDEATDLLWRAGFAFSPSSWMDLILQYHIEKGIYDIMEINEALYCFNMPLLGARSNV